MGEVSLILDLMAKVRAIRAIIAVLPEEHLGGVEADKIARDLREANNDLEELLSRREAELQRSVASLAASLNVQFPIPTRNTDGAQ